MVKLFLRWGGWVAAIPLVIGLVAAFAWVQIADRSARFDDAGVEVTATVTGKRESRRMGGSGTRTTDYYVRVSYSTGSALEGTLDIHFAEEQVSSGFYERVSRGDKVPVRVLPDEPGTVEIEPGATSSNALWAGVAGAVFILLGLALIGFGIRAAARAIRIRDSGVETEARADDIVVQGQFRTLKFSFTDEQGQPRSAKSRPARARRFEGIAPGAPVRVFYDPERPERAYWEGDVGPRGG